MRKRTRKSFSYGSTWISDAPFLMASMRIRFTSLTTGASSAALAISSMFSSSCLGDLDVVVAISPTMSSSEGPFSA